MAIAIQLNSYAVPGKSDVTATRARSARAAKSPWTSILPMQYGKTAARKANNKNIYAKKDCILESYRLYYRACRGVAQPGRVLAWGARGRRFDSCHPDHKIQSAIGRFIFLSPGIDAYCSSYLPNDIIQMSGHNNQQSIKKDIK